MASTPKANDIHIYLRDGLKERLQVRADRERRSLSNMALVIIEKDLEADRPLAGNEEQP